MTERELKRLRRADLLEMMVALSKENEQLKIQLKETQQKVDDKSIAIKKAGSIAEASLQLNGVFEAAQNACDQYVANLQMIVSRYKKRCAAMEEKTKEECAKMLEETRQQCDGIWEELNAKVKDLSGDDIDVRQLILQRPNVEDQDI